MKTRINLSTAACTAVALILPWAGRTADLADLPGSELSRCQKVAEAVRLGIEKEPHKVLLIVEDAMVANESCAYEIVQAAILASDANATLARQIALTATHIAPNMAAVIAESANSALRLTSPTGGKEVVEAVNEVVGVQPEGPGSSVGTDYSLVPSDIRGVYLIMPTTGGFTTATATTTTKVVVKRVTPRRSKAQSPSVAHGP